MGSINDFHISEFDLSELEKYIVTNGKECTFRKKQYLLKQNDKNTSIGFISKGMFRYTRIDNSGNEHIVGYSFEREFVGEYTANLCKRESLVNIQAITDSVVFLVEYAEVEKIWNTTMEYQRLGRIVAEQLFALTYRRLIDSYCSTPEERYLDLMKRYPKLKELIPLKEIASFIGVTPETVSIIRRKLLKK